MAVSVLVKLALAITTLGGGVHLALGVTTLGGGGQLALAVTTLEGGGRQLALAITTPGRVHAAVAVTTLGGVHAALVVTALGGGVQFALAITATATASLEKRLGVTAGGGLSGAAAAKETLEPRSLGTGLLLLRW